MVSHSSRYDYAFAAKLARLAESLLETARREPASYDFDLSTDFSWAQHWLDEARHDKILGPHFTRAAVLNLYSALAQDNALVTVVEKWKLDSVLAEEGVLDSHCAPLVRNSQFEHFAVPPDSFAINKDIVFVGIQS